MVYCSIRTCQSRSVKGGATKFIRFPKKESVAQKWLRYCSPKTSTKHGRVCSNHFSPSDYIKSLQLHIKEAPIKVRLLKPDAIPLLHMPNTNNHRTVKEAIQTIEIDNKVKLKPLDILETSDTDKPEVLDIHETSFNVTEIPDGLPSQIDFVQTKHIPIVSIDIPSESNTTPVNEFLDSSKVVNESGNTITIPMAEYKQLQNTAKRFNVLKSNLEKIFTHGQIRCLMLPKMPRVRWYPEDIAAAITLKSKINHKGYSHLRDTVGFPLPSIKTIAKWVEYANHNNIPGPK